MFSFLERRVLQEQTVSLLPCCYRRRVPHLSFLFFFRVFPRYDIISLSLSCIDSSSRLSRDFSYLYLCVFFFLERFGSCVDSHVYVCVCVYFFSIFFKNKKIRPKGRLTEYMQTDKC